MPRRSHASLGLWGVGILGLLIVPAASAMPTVVNVGQPAAQSASAPGPIELADRGDCASGRTIEEANGSQSPCPPGTWPAPGTAWAPTIRVASGDALDVSFDERVERLAVLLTSDYPPGLTTPDRQPVPNVTLGEVIASPASEDGRRWTLRVPALDRRAQSESFAVLSISALGGAAPVNLAFGLRTPRPADFSAGCGPAYFSASESDYFCDPAKVQFTKGSPPPGLIQVCAVAALLRPASEGRRQTVIVGQPRPCPPPGRSPADFTITTDFGDGSRASTPVTDPTNWLIGGTHTHRRAGTYATTLRGAILVPNAPLTALRSARPAFTPKKAESVVIARFRDGNQLAVAADHRAAITWGDGTSSTGRVVRVAPGRFAVRATHRYRTAARRRIVVRIQDDRGGTLRVRTAPRVRRAQPAPHASSRSGERDDSAARGVYRSARSLRHKGCR